MASAGTITGTFDFKGWRNGALILGVGALAVSLAGAFLGRQVFFASYLQGFMLCLAPALGASYLWMILFLTGGEWGKPIYPAIKAAVRTLPLVTILFLPLFFGFHDLYAWMAPGVTAHDEMLKAKEWYLNIPFFTARAVVYFVLWNLLAIYLRSLEAKYSTYPDGTPQKRKLQTRAAVVLIAFCLAITFAAVDWISSLEAHWYSSIFGVLIAVGQLQFAFAFTTLIAILLKKGGRLPDFNVEQLHDLGKFMFMTVMLWAYVNFSQYLIIWSGQISEELIYYSYRMKGGWEWWGLALLVGNFAIPFLLLLSRSRKRDLNRLMKVCVFLLVMRWVDMVWHVLPNFSHSKIAVHWLDVALPVGLLGVWFAAFLFFLEKQIGGAAPQTAHASALPQGPQDQPHGAKRKGGPNE